MDEISRQLVFNNIMKLMNMGRPDFSLSDSVASSDKVQILPDTMLSQVDRKSSTRPVAIWLAISFLQTLTIIQTTTCFSTQRSEMSMKSFVSSSNGGSSNIMRAAGFKINPDRTPRGNSYTANYITAIEDNYNNCADNGTQAFLVSTTDHNYAISSPCLLDRGWRSVTVNGEQVYILTGDNRAMSTTLYNLDEQQRDFIAEVRSNFTQNLAGLKFSRYTSGSSIRLPFSRHAAPALGSANGYTGPSIAASTISRIANSNSNNNNNNRLGTNEHDWTGGSQQSVGPATVPAGNYHRKSVSWTGRGALRDLHSIAEPASMSQSRSVCLSNRKVYGNHFNHYELYNARLNATLAGDIYLMDFYCNILDVYSSTVTVRQLPDTSVLYRNPSYFSLARSNLPMAINRFFLVNENVFFVYNDGSVLVKPKWQLDQIELDTVMQARDWLFASQLGWPRRRHQERHSRD